MEESRFWLMKSRMECLIRAYAKQMGYIFRTRRQKQTRHAKSKPDITLLWNKYNRYLVTKTVSTQYLTLSKIVKHAEPFNIE